MDLDRKETRVSRLDQKVVLITGAKGGLGTFVTQAFLEAGATVAGVSRSIAAADFAHPGFVAMPAELSNEEATRTLVEKVAAELGRIDALVHLVGGYAGGKSVAETEDSTMARMLDLNLWPAFRVVRSVVPHMRSQGEGRILAVGSRAAVDASPTAAAYSASKAALVALIRAVAAENSDRCISANVVLPGTMDTPANRSADPQADFSRWVQPAQVAALLVHLAAADGSQVNGAAIPVYGRGV
jgi:NAD(P)-dependent dehydrogenase (short-subunit alcohol dehydrogenase family)